MTKRRRINLLLTAKMPLTVLEIIAGLVREAKVDEVYHAKWFGSGNLGNPLLALFERTRMPSFHILRNGLDSHQSVLKI